MVVVEEVPREGRGVVTDVSVVVTGLCSDTVVDQDRVQVVRVVTLLDEG